jgi:hypothetical protein
VDIDAHIEELCGTYGVSRAFGERLRPLLLRAMKSTAEKRARLLQLVERSFAEEAARPPTTMTPSDLPQDELAALRTVAGVLHSWNPPVWLKMWTRQMGEDDPFQNGPLEF